LWRLSGDAAHDARRDVQILELDDVVALLRREVEKAGGQAAWAKSTGTDRSLLNKVLKGHRPPTAKMIAALNLRVVFTPGNGSWLQRLPRQTP
jgi:DNA-binding phage protein